MFRRNFIKGLGATAFGLKAPMLFAAPESSPRFLFIFLRGAYDSNSVLVPYSSDFYYQSRPNISIPAPRSGGDGASIRLDAEWSLAPSVRESLLPLWNDKQLCFVPFAGTEDMSRSHFETQNSIEISLPDNSRSKQTGFLSRLSQELEGKTSSISFTAAVPLIFKGEENVPNFSLRKVSDANAPSKKQLELLADLYSGSPYQLSVEEGLAIRANISKSLADEMENSAKGAIGASSFEQEARRIAVMMRSQFKLGFLDVGGWDTHVNQGGATGSLAAKLASLGLGLAAYADELGSEWEQTVVTVISEFGRTFRENGNKGTDHGHGTVYWILGGGISGGKILGEQLAVNQANLLENRDYKVLNSYENILGSIFKQLWGLSNERVTRIFPGCQLEKARFIKEII